MALIKTLVQLYNAGRFRELIELGQKELSALTGSSKDDAGLLVGVAFLSLKQPEAAINYLEPLSKRLQRDDIFSNLGLAYQDKKYLPKAQEAFLKALECNPNSLAALSNLGGLLRETRQFAEASNYLRRALALDPNSPNVLINLALVERDRLNFPEALNLLRQGLQKHPDNGDIQSRLAITLLMMGKWREAWPHYEVRLAAQISDKIDAVPLPNLPKPRWPKDKKVKRMLVVGEQGLGDQVAFARFTQALATGGMEVWLSVEKPLIPLMRTLPWVERIIPRGQEKEVVKDCDAWEMLLSLPWRLGLSPGNIPSFPAYLTAPPDMVIKWRQILGPKHRKRMGLVWRGRAENTLDERRSLTAELLAMALKNRGDWELVSLQKEVSQAELACFPGIREYGSQLADFGDSAGLMANLDALITVDTAVAHVAGALGVKTYCLLSWVPDWRWGIKGSKTPWYPSMTTLRQERADDWLSALQHLPIGDL